MELGLTDAAGDGSTALAIGNRYTSETAGTTDGAAEALDDVGGYNVRFRVDTLPPLVFGKDDKSKSVEITFYPLQSAAADEAPLLLGIVPNPTAGLLPPTRGRPIRYFVSMMTTRSLRLLLLSQPMALSLPSPTSPPPLPVGGYASRLI